MAADNSVTPEQWPAQRIQIGDPDFAAIHSPRVRVAPGDSGALRPVRKRSRAARAAAVVPAWRLWRSLSKNEHDLTKRSLADIAAAFPDGRACLAPGVGHAWNGEKPELFAAMIRARVMGDPLPEELVVVR